MYLILVSQANWSYCNKRGQLYKVGVYHGDDSGNVLIYCNNQILTIDFEVSHTKSYTFYLDQDVCEVSIEASGRGYQYDFRVNDEKASDLPHLQNKDQNEQTYLLYVSLAGLLLFSLIFSLSSMFVQSLG